MFRVKVLKDTTACQFFSIFYRYSAYIIDFVLESKVRVRFSIFCIFSISPACSFLVFLVIGTLTVYSREISHKTCLKLNQLLETRMIQIQFIH